MAKNKDVNRPLNYRIGIDVGSHSTGFCAVEVDDQGIPIRILNSLVFRHDSGVDPDSAKTAATRKASSGVARRTRRLYRVRRARLAALDKKLVELGYPIVDLESLSAPRAPWHIRARLVHEFIADEDERKEALSIALRHIARHRGWRNPYSKVESLFAVEPPSDFLKGLNDRVSDAIGEPMPADATPGQLISAYLQRFETGRVRGPEDTKKKKKAGILSEKLHQSDNAAEIRSMCAMQRVPAPQVEQFIRAVFWAKSPKGSAASLRGKDALPGQGHLPRAEKAHPAFQLYRIVAVLANLRVRDEGELRALTEYEMQSLVDFLRSPDGDLPTWDDIADNLGIDRKDLEGTASPGPDGTPSLAHPPFDDTDRKIRESKIPWLVEWWDGVDDDRKGKMIDALSNSGGSEEDFELDDEVAEILEKATEEDQAKLDNLELHSGRAAYSLDSLRRLTDHMLSHGVDLHEARKAVFGVDDSWVPPADPIGAPVGNPSVDRVTKQVARYLKLATKRWGAPQVVNIEHVRDGLGSERLRREQEEQNKKRHERNQQAYQAMHDTLQLSGRPQRSDLRRYQALQRQGGQCLYCGAEIFFQTAEMDHIVPRAGAASTNAQNNLAAVCRECNHSKGKVPFAVWAKTTDRPVVLSEVINRVNHWVCDPGLSKKDFDKYKAAVKKRLKSTNPDDELDARSIESVAWMASELRHRIEQHYRRMDAATRVDVYSGSITAEGRKASGFEGRVNLVGGKGKTRFDRRHHAMDALTIALMNRSVAMTLALRDNIRYSQQLTGQPETWKTFTGETAAAKERWNQWDLTMRKASDLFNVMLTQNAVPIMQNLRLRHGSGAVHEASIHKLTHLKLSSELSVNQIDRAATPALWTALTRCPDFDEKAGLPANPDRVIAVNGRHLRGDDVVDFFKTGAACVAVRGGYAELGSAIHHARIYRIDGKKTTYAMVRVYQVDLLRRRKEDLFSVPLPASCISMRAAHSKIRKAIADGSATQIAWMVSGDELRIDMSAFTEHAIGEFSEKYPECVNWEVSGFSQIDKLTLKPHVLSAEGIPEDSPDSVRKIVSKKGTGWVVSINQLLSHGNVELIRRNALGVERWSTDSGLPVSARLS